MIVYRLSRSQQFDNQKSVLLNFGHKIIRSIRLGLLFHPTWSDQKLLLNEDQRRQWMKDSF